MDDERNDARWDVLLSPSAIRNLDQLSPRVVPAIIEFLYGPLAGNPLRVGKPLRGDFEGSYSARRGAYRVLYEVDPDPRVVRVYRISARDVAYRQR
jgi:mRNA-degrading endonuclease RelE of RelBE toxin-antitoxin system